MEEDRFASLKAKGIIFSFMWICDINSLFFFRGKNNKFYMYLYVVL
jgi:hypothetical protein